MCSKHKEQYKEFLFKILFLSPAMCEERKSLPYLPPQNRIETEKGCFRGVKKIECENSSGQLKELLRTFSGDQEKIM